MSESDYGVCELNGGKEGDQENLVERAGYEFRTAKKGNLAVFSISVYPSLNNFRISAFSKVKYQNQRRKE